MGGRFDRYILAQLLMLFGFFALVLVLVYWVNRAVVLFDQLIANGQSAAVFLEFSALTLPNVIRVVLPIAAFAGTVYAINRLITESELVVVQATGFSPWRLVRPVIVFGVIIFVLSSILAHLLVPISTARLTERTAEISENMTARLLSEGRFLHPADGVTFYIREITPLGSLSNIFLSDSRTEGRTVTYTAREALLIRGEDAPSLVMIDGMAQVYDEASRRLSVTRFDDFAFDLEGLVEGISGDRRRPAELSTLALLAATPETQELTRSSRATLIAEAHERFSNALNGLVAPLIGFSALLVGGFSRFGVRRQILGAIFALIIVQMVTQAGQGAVQGDERMWPFAYAGPLLGLFMAWGLLLLAARPTLLRLRRVRA
ncbi:LPS export ABC transporter permease LptF [Silicimonas algicola]|uniref:Lipopolysaccharide export system permease protein n=1 Tax=Silicimonas algicola TaxID=1826607 RepID=A0A316GD52_9RHOB|nr:LPS export ABC transporter permease LptF [Silicimonas algicola]AZQ67698.1 LPS export ABC transporter permease LptF [Silicimonas algicola]PWK57896.1 lipopolysaccharide export system permease protein [Silicimonas algicola]